MIIANRTSHNFNRWVELRNDGTAFACSVGNPINVTTKDGRQVLQRLAPTIHERPVLFKDEAELRKVAYQFIRTGAVDTAAQPAPAVTEGPVTPIEASTSEADVPGE
jgi:hypothetical protein